MGLHRIVRQRDGLPDPQTAQQRGYIRLQMLLPDDPNGRPEGKDVTSLLKPVDLAVADMADRQHDGHRGASAHIVAEQRLGKVAGVLELGEYASLAGRPGIVQAWPSHPLAAVEARPEPSHWITKAEEVGVAGQDRTQRHAVAVLDHSNVRLCPVYLFDDMADLLSGRLADMQVMHCPTRQSYRCAAYYLQAEAPQQALANIVHPARPSLLRKVQALLGRDHGPPPLFPQQLATAQLAAPFQSKEIPPPWLAHQSGRSTALCKDLAKPCCSGLLQSTPAPIEGMKLEALATHRKPTVCLSGSHLSESFPIE